MHWSSRRVEVSMRESVSEKVGMGRGGVVASDVAK